MNEFKDNLIVNKQNEISSEMQKDLDNIDYSDTKKWVESTYEALADLMLRQKNENAVDFINISFANFLKEKCDENNLIGKKIINYWDRGYLELRKNSNKNSETEELSDSGILGDILDKLLIEQLNIAWTEIRKDLEKHIEICKGLKFNQESSLFEIDSDYKKMLEDFANSGEMKQKNISTRSKIEEIVSHLKAEIQEVRMLLTNGNLRAYHPEEINKKIGEKNNERIKKTGKETKDFLALAHHIMGTNLSSCVASTIISLEQIEWRLNHELQNKVSRVIGLIMTMLNIVGNPDEIKESDLIKRILESRDIVLGL
jgi:hypothetical protein